MSVKELSEKLINLRGREWRDLFLPGGIVEARVVEVTRAQRGSPWEEWIRWGEAFLVRFICLDVTPMQ